MEITQDSVYTIKGDEVVFSCKCQAAAQATCALTWSNDDGDITAGVVAEVSWDGTSLTSTYTRMIVDTDTVEDLNKIKCRSTDLTTKNLAISSVLGKSKRLLFT